jgi:hypothetical protein
MSRRPGRTSIPKLPLTLGRIVYSCSVHCVAACCGTSAFEIHTKHILPWIEEHRIDRVVTGLNQLERIQAIVRHREGEVYSRQEDFNAVWKKPQDCLDYLGDWQHAILGALVTHCGTEFIDRSWLTCNNGLVRTIAVTIRERSEFSDLPILADALEEAGCQNAVLLDHCRKWRHREGSCWIVDLLLNPNKRVRSLTSRQRTKTVCEKLVP